MEQFERKRNSNRGRWGYVEAGRLSLLDPYKNIWTYQRRGTKTLNHLHKKWVFSQKVVMDQNGPKRNQK